MELDSRSRDAAFLAAKVTAAIAEFLGTLPVPGERLTVQVGLAQVTAGLARGSALASLVQEWDQLVLSVAATATTTSKTLSPSRCRLMLPIG